jgi:hypothetical protein
MRPLFPGSQTRIPVAGCTQGQREGSPLPSKSKETNLPLASRSSNTVPLLRGKMIGVIALGLFLSAAAEVMGERMLLSPCCSRWRYP